MKGLLIVERFILESLANGNYSETEIQEKTRLNLMFVKNILKGLQHREIIEEINGRYQIIQNKKQEIINEINSKESVKAEVKELFTSFVNEFYNSEREQMSLNVKKVALDKMEEKILDSHIKNLQDFFKGITPKKEKDIAGQRVVIWGDCQYYNLVNSSLKFA